MYASMIAYYILVHFEITFVIDFVFNTNFAGCFDHVRSSGYW